MTPEQPTPIAGLVRAFKERYQPAYRVLLILSSLAALLSLTGVATIRTAIDQLPKDIFYGISGLASTLIVLPLMIASLILLWNKHPFGIKLRLIAYGATILANICSFFTSPETMRTATQEAVESAIKGNSAMNADTAFQIAQTSFYGAIWLSIAGSILFAWLWWSAWRRQVKHDNKKTAAR